MRDRDVRESLRCALRLEHEHDPTTLIVEELGLCERASRIDVAVVNGTLNGYEIKSERDTLDRLQAQASIYSRIFDTVTLVCAETHTSATLKLVPPWWGIIQATAATTAVELTPFRMPLPNPAVDAYALAQLLWREEALALLVRIQRDTGVRTKKREHIWQRLADTMPLGDLNAAVRATLKSRQGWRDRA